MPNPEQAVVGEQKVRGYLLSRFHQVGRAKAAFFRSLGYEAEAWKVLEEDLREQHACTHRGEVNKSEFGCKFVVSARLVGPSGASAEVVSVWIVLTGKDVPRLVTAYPGGDR